MGAYLAALYADDEWLDVLQDDVERQSDPPTSKTAGRTLLKKYATAPTSRFLLAVVGGKVQVVYGLGTCWALDEAGRVYAGLIGDRTVRGTVTLPPCLYAIGAKGEDHDNQYLAVYPVKVRAGSVAQILDALDAEPGPALVAPRPEGSEGAVVSAPKALPVHAKLAALFMDGMSPRLAFRFFVKFMQAVPAPDRPLGDRLIEFARAAVTETDGASALGHEWRALNPFSSEDLQDWYLEVVSAHAPQLTGPSGPNQPALAPAPVPPAEVPAQTLEEYEDPYARRAKRASPTPPLQARGLLWVVTDEG